MQVQPPLYGSTYVEEREEEPVDRMLPTEKAEEILLALWLIVMLAFLLLRWEMTYLTLPIIWLLFLAVFFFKPSLDVEVERVVPHSRFLEGGSEVEITLRVKSHERIPTLKITEDVPPGLELVGGDGGSTSCPSSRERRGRYGTRSALSAESTSSTG